MLYRVGVLFVLCFALANADDCDKSKCPGPLQFYEDLRCKPVYKSADDCCAERYDCSHLHERSTKKCYINDNVYEIGQALTKEDANPCDVGCYCAEGIDGIAQFRCAIVDCFNRASPGCYLQKNATNCCASNEICPEKQEDIPTCEVEGKTYKDGEYFALKSEPSKTCYCGPGYKGENVEPFCISPKHPWCSPELSHAYEIHKKCAPSYYSTQSPQTGCAAAYRCQNDKDVVIPSSAEEARSDNPDMQCQFGDLKMKLGDELNQATDYSSVCVKCVCEVPPVPTCQRLPDEECDVTKHPPFEH